MTNLWIKLKDYKFTFGASFCVTALFILYILICLFEIIPNLEKYSFYSLPFFSFVILALMYLVIDTYEDLKHRRRINYYNGPQESLAIVKKIVKQSIEISKKKEVEIYQANMEISNPSAGQFQSFDKDIREAILDVNKERKLYYKYLIGRSESKEQWCKIIETELGDKLPIGKFQLKYTQSEIKLPFFNLLVVPELRTAYIGFGNDPAIYEGGVLINGDEEEDFTTKFKKYFDYIWENFTTPYEPSMKEFKKQ